MLNGEQIDPAALAHRAADFTRFADPQARLEHDRRVLGEIASELAAEYPHVARLLAQEPQPGQSLLVVGIQYFFRRAVESDPELARGLTLSKLEHLTEQQNAGFANLDAILKDQGERLDTLLDEIHTLVSETHDVVLDLRDQMEGQSEQIREVSAAVHRALEQHQLQRRELRPSDSLSIRNDGERQLVKQLVARYRALPEAERRQVPELLTGIGKLEVVAGDFDAAQRDFQAVAELEQDNKAQADAHYNAYRVSLEKRDLAVAMQEFIKAVKLDAKRLAPFPVGKYQPIRILGAGGFGVAFLCKHKYMSSQVVVKTLSLDDLGRDADAVFAEAHALRQLDHPAVIRISDCGYSDPSAKSRPFLVMDYFAGKTLEQHVASAGPLRAGDLLAVASQVAAGLQAAHGKNILHRDVKPANLLVNKGANGWSVKLIDFGLALRQKVVQKSMNASTATRQRTLLGVSMVGTIDYAAPEQIGRRDDPVGPYSDVYGFAKTCCYALFQTPQPLFKHWQSIPPALAKLLEQCLDEDPKVRPANFSSVCRCLKELSEPVLVLPATADDLPVVSLADAKAPAASNPGPETRCRGRVPGRAGRRRLEHRPPRVRS